LPAVSSPHKLYALMVEIPIPALNHPGRFRPDVRLLFLTRILRMFAFGLLSVILVLYLSQRGLSTKQIGALFSCILLGDTAISLWMTTSADRIGRKKMLIAGAGLMLMAGLGFALTANFAALLLTGIVGVISPAANEAGPFLSIEQAALSQTTSGQNRTNVFAWYNLAGSFAAALGALAGGTSTQWLQGNGRTMLASYQAIVLVYGFIGLLLAVLFLGLTNLIEAEPSKVAAGTRAKTFLGLHQSRNVILKLSALFALDSFAGGFVMQSLLAYWFHLRFGVSPAMLGGIFFGANVFAGFSALAASRIAARIGLIETMVYTHVPSNLMLIMLPFMPNLSAAITILLLRFALSQMDVPTRQSYTMSIVHPDERSAAAGVTGTARTIGVSLSPLLAGPMLASAALLNAPLIIAGVLKIIYDVALYRSFKKHKTLEPESKA
jgi:MFS family permease